MSEDPFAGYEGAIDCVVRGGGDIAWTKLSAVKEYFDERKQRVSIGRGTDTLPPLHVYII